MADTTGLGAAIEAAINEAVQKAIGNQGTATTPEAKVEQPKVEQPEPYQMTQENIATPTDVGEFNAPIEQKSNMKVGEYSNPYQQQQQQLVQQLGDAKLYETPQQTETFIQDLFKRQVADFQYDKEQDPLVQKARKEVEDSVKNMAAKRGFEFSSATQDLVAQQMAKVEPQFEQIAYDQRNDFLNRELGLANTIMQWEQIQFDRSKNQVDLIKTKLDFINQLDQQEFNKFKVILEQRNFNRTMYLNKQKFDLQKKLEQQDLALKRLENMGYVDKQTSLVLGIPVGTKAQWAQQMALEQANKIELMARQNKYDTEKQKLDAKIEKELYALKDRLDTESQLKLQAQTYNYKKQLQTMEYDYQKKKQSIEMQQAAEEAAQKAAIAAAKEEAKYVGGSSKSGGNGKSSKSTGMTAAQLKRSYYAEVKKFLKKYGSAKKQKSQSAAKYLNSLKALGVNDAVIAMIRNNYNVPKYKKQTKAQARVSEAKTKLKKVTKKGGSTLELFRGW